MVNTRVRTNSLAKKPKLKWWYAIPVVLVVALIGYVVIVYSKASNRFYSKTVNNQGLQGGVSTTADSKSEGKKRLVGTTPVSATFTAKEMSKAKKVCAGLSLEDRSKGQLILESNSTVVAMSSNQQQTTIDTKSTAGSDQVCLPIDSVNSALAQSYGAKASVVQTAGDIAVMEIWLEGD